MKRLIELISFRCHDIKVLDQFGDLTGEEEEKRVKGIAMKKAEVRWLVKEYMRFNVKVDFGASDETKVTIDIPADDASVTIQACFNEQLKISPRFGKRRMTVAITDILLDLNKRVPEGIPSNLATA